MNPSRQKSSIKNNERGELHTTELRFEAAFFLKGLFSFDLWVDQFVCFEIFVQALFTFFFETAMHI